MMHSRMDSLGVHSLKLEVGPRYSPNYQTNKQMVGCTATCLRYLFSFNRKLIIYKVANLPMKCFICDVSLDLCFHMYQYSIQESTRNIIENSVHEDRCTLRQRDTERWGEKR